MSLTLSQVLYISGGIGVTLQYSLLALVGGSLLGAVLSLMRLCPVWILRMFAQMYVSIFRGTPLLVQLSLAYFALPSLLGYKISPLEAGLCAFGLNSAAYVSEIFRGGLTSIDSGQFEAAQALSIPTPVIYTKVIFPQVLRSTLPALTNEMISLLKESAIISVIGEVDIMRRAQIVASETYNFFPPLILAGFYYYILVMILTSLARRLERKMA